MIEHIMYLTNLAMNWYSWLSKTSLSPSHVYEYGLTFICKGLQKEDVLSFNHEFLQSMGISIAKHRLEILKLARKETGAHSHDRLSRLVLVIIKTKRCLAKCIRMLVYQDHSTPPANRPISNSSPYQVQWREETASGNHKSSKEDNKEEKVVEPLDGRVKERHKVLSGPLDRRGKSGPLDPRLMMLTCGGPSVSGPLDGRRQDKFVYSNRSPRFMSGPMEGSMQQRLRYTKRSPRVSGPLDGRVSPKVYGVYNKENGDDGLQSIWATLFQDMKPT